MKKLIFTLGTIFFLFTACEGPQGPPGFDGINILGQTFERTVNFQFNNQNGLQESLITIPTSIEVFESDAILVYRLEGQLPDNVDLWSLIPQNFFLDNGDIIQYVYNHTFFDIMLQIDGNFDLSTVPSNFTQNQTFRFVVVPSDFATRSGIDIRDYNAVMNALHLD
ncbi:MAG: collagen-like protein [Flavobacteriaceae bacterium]|nr:collagen-like protein [Flavobacteriaceae bacterium]